jgi:hypothetical protein
MQGHFLRAAMDMLNFSDGAALIDVYTSVPGGERHRRQHGNERGRMAVASRMAPVFVHDPARATICGTGSIWSVTRSWQTVDDPLHRIRGRDR